MSNHQTKIKAWRQKIYISYKYSYKIPSTSIKMKNLYIVNIIAAKSYKNENGRDKKDNNHILSIFSMCNIKRKSSPRSWSIFPSMFLTTLSFPTYFNFRGLPKIIAYSILPIQKFRVPTELCLQAKNNIMNIIWNFLILCF